MMRIYFALIVITFLMQSCSHRYYIVRHAEKEIVAGNANSSAEGPALSEAGKVRALVLRDELKDKHIRYIFVTNTLRAISTATPLSTLTNIPLRRYNSTDSLAGFVTQLKAIRKNVLIVAHSNTVDDIVNQLCNATKIAKDLPESQYDNLYIVTIKGKKIMFKQTKYGYASNPE